MKNLLPILLTLLLSCNRDKHDNIESYKRSFVNFQFSYTDGGWGGETFTYYTEDGKVYLAPITDNTARDFKNIRLQMPATYYDKLSTLYMKIKSDTTDKDFICCLDCEAFRFSRRSQIDTFRIHQTRYLHPLFVPFVDSAAVYLKPIWRKMGRRNFSTVNR